MSKYHSYQFPIFDLLDPVSPAAGLQVLAASIHLTFRGKPAQDGVLQEDYGYLVLQGVGLGGLQSPLIIYFSYYVKYLHT